MVSGLIIILICAVMALCIHYVAKWYEKKHEDK